MWDVAVESAFTALKSAMLTVPVLQMPNFALLFEIETDASGKGVRVVLSQQHPLAFFSKPLGVRGQTKSIHEKELMAIVMAVQK